MCLVGSILKGAIYQAICYVVCEQAGALWRWGGKRSAPESLLAGYLQSSLCAVAPSQTRGMTVHGLFALYLKSASIGPVLFKTYYR